MSNNSQICDYHRKNEFCFGYSLNKDRCCICRSVFDCKISYDTRKNHVSGVTCKNANHCSICSRIKSMVLLLKHAGGSCNPKKCQFCGSEYRHRSNHQQRLKNEIQYAMTIIYFEKLPKRETK